jgi:formylglycine-generating enzyme required for sulfatase activity
MKIRNAPRLTLALIWIAAIGGGTDVLAAAPASIELVKVEPGTHRYRASGAFLKGGRPVGAPTVSIRIDAPLEIMKYQVSVEDYFRCVSDEACARPFGKRQTNKKLPVTGVNYFDVQNYIKWLGGKTGTLWRLPTDIEWSYAAGSRFVDDALGDDAGVRSDPSKAWLAQYKKLAALGRPDDQSIKVRGTHGANEHGIYDLSANVWEWTSTCFTRTEITETSQIGSVETKNCGVRVVEGRHRAYMTDFIRDAKSGGCSVGAPPDHLGFRLVKDAPSPWLINKLRAWWSRLISAPVEVADINARSCTESGSINKSCP